MELELDVVETETQGVLDLHASVIDGDKKTRVRFRVDGKPKGLPSSVNSDGVASTEVKLSIGEHEITAEIVGNQSIAVSHTVNITAKVKVKKPTHWLGWVGTALFIVTALWFGYTALTTAGLLVALILMALATGLQMLKDEEDWDRKSVWKAFKPRLLNNNWVFWAFFGLSIYCIIRWITSFNGTPIPEINPLKIAIHSLHKPAYNPYGEDDGGWGMKAIAFIIWTFVAYPVHFWDDWIEKSKAKKGEAKGTHEQESHWLLHGVVSEILGTIAERMIPFLHRKHKTEAKHDKH